MQDDDKQKWKKDAEWIVAMLLILIIVGVLAGVGALLVMGTAQWMGIT